MKNQKPWLGFALLLGCLLCISAPPAQAQVAPIGYTSCEGFPTPLLDHEPAPYSVCQAGTNYPDLSLTYAGTSGSGTCYYDLPNLDQTASISGDSYAEASLDEYYEADVNSITSFVGIDTVLGANYPDEIDTNASAESDDITVYSFSEAACDGAMGYDSNDDIDVYTDADTILGSRA